MKKILGCDEFKKHSCSLYTEGKLIEEQVMCDLSMQAKMRETFLKKIYMRKTNNI